MKRRFAGCEPKRVVLWTLACFLGLQVALNLYMETRHAEVYDPEYRDRLVLLRQRVQEHPQRPLLLIVGSSRIMTGVAPEQLPPLHSADGACALPFNACHTGAGTVHNLLMVERLLREGFEPKWMVVEVVPYLLPAAQHSTLAKLAMAEDLPTLHRYVKPLKLYGWYAEERATAIINHRHAFLRHLAPGLPLQDHPWDCMPMEPLGGKTWEEPIPDRAEIERRTAVVRANYHASLQRFQIQESSKRAMQELLGLCRKRNIQVAVLVSPESSEFRGWYSPDASHAVDGFLEELASQYGTPIVDARDWLADEDFSDGHHVLPEGAKKLTARLGRELLAPLVRNELRGYAPGESPTSQQRKSTVAVPVNRTK